MKPTLRLALVAAVMAVLASMAQARADEILASPKVREMMRNWETHSFVEEDYLDRSFKTIAPKQWALQKESERGTGILADLAFRPTLGKSDKHVQIYFEPKEFEVAPLKPLPTDTEYNLNIED